MDYLATAFAGFVFGMIAMVIFLSQIPLENSITEIAKSSGKCKYVFGNHFFIEECGKFQVGDILVLVKEVK